MQQIRVFFLIIFLISNSLNGISMYNEINIGTIMTGKEEGLLGYLSGMIPGGGYPQAQTFTISVDNKIYISDWVNGRINVYDINLNYLKMIVDSNHKIERSISLFFDDKNNLYGSYPTVGITKINFNGKLIYFKDYEKLRSILYDNDYFYPMQENLLYYDKFMKIGFFNDSGNKITNEDALKLLEEMKNKYPGEIHKDSGLKDKLDDFLKKNSLILYNDRLLARHTGEFETYFTFLRENIKDKKLKDKVSVDLTGNSCIIRGYDTNKNYYFQGKILKSNTPQFIICVVNKYGEILDYFLVEHEYYHAIAPNGDVWHWERKPNGVIFYKTKNVWDSIDPPESITKQTTSTVTSLTASSFVDYKNLYHPLKAFDGDIKTTWLEAAKGPGIGESIILELGSEITIDSITVLPGYFDTKWWKSNNRVKSLIMKIGDDITTLQFGDEMKPFKADFKEPKKFKKVEFIIKEIYSSGKDDDTAISEIQFYNKGERIKLDFSKQEAELNKSK